MSAVMADAAGGLHLRPKARCSPASPHGSASASRPAGASRAARQHADLAPTQPPDAVLFAETNAEVVETVKLCAEARVPVIPFGTGTSLEGHVNAPFGGMSLDLSRMNRILAVHEADLDCVVEPGVTRKALNDHLRDQGLFFAVDPGADASLGGMAATRASGTNAVRYGTMRDDVSGLTRCWPTARAQHRAGRGSRQRLRPHPSHDRLRGHARHHHPAHAEADGIPETILSAVCPFATLEGACNATIIAMQMGLPLARIELADEVQIRACNAYSHLTFAEQPTLFLEFTAAPPAARAGRNLRRDRA